MATSSISDTAAEAACRLAQTLLKGLRMDFGFYLPTRGQTATPEALETLVTRGEALGFRSVMIADHVVFPTEVRSPYPYTVSGAFPGHGDALEQLTTLAFLAGMTERLRLVTSVMILPYRNPVLTAKMLATVDVLSQGRVTVGVGVGWLREEFEALHTPDFAQRGAVSNEYLQIFKTLWTQNPADFVGRFYRFTGVRCLPHPVQKPHPPLWIGGHSRAALRRVARYGDGWHPVGANPAVPLRPRELESALEDLKRLIDAEGRDPAAVAVSFKAPLYDVSPSVEQQAGLDRRPFSGSPEQVIEDIASYGRLGVSELIFDFRSEALTESLERMEHFAGVIKPAADRL
jgi:probable F420-dependent oxidoreductase